MRMQYRRFGQIDFKVSALGFGCMRLPIKASYSDIDEPEAIKMLHYAIEHGVNYIDSAYGYHDGNSELLVRKALKGGYRDKVKIATKLPCWKVKEYSDFDRFLNEQLKKFQVEHIDFYLLHGLNKEYWHRVRDLGVLEWAEGAQADGRIGHLGFSFHDHYEVFQEIVDAYDKWTLCQIQYNYMDVENQAGEKGLKYAASKGIAVVVMEGLLGGYLINPPPVVEELWDSAEKKRTTADWALQWLWNQSKVSTVLSGMSTMEQVRQNVVSADNSKVGLLSQEELDLVNQVREEYLKLRPIPCTSCRYCLPCPHDVEIPRNFELYNNLVLYKHREDAENEYKEELKEESRASACIQCRECEEKCPQHILISEWMSYVHATLGEGKEPVHSLT
jgi:predicted aldo/keto reductase-like oxidoreductase